MRKTAVLIVGAGPTGLLMASLLALHHVPFIILEKEQGPTDESRAIGIQARTLEIFRQMGIDAAFIKGGYKAKGLNFMTKGKVLQQIPLSGMGEGLSKFPFLLIHEQQKTERILLNFLTRQGHHIEWNTEVLSFTEDDQTVTTSIKRNAKEETIESEWIIGSDGAHSIVRHVLGIPLEGKTYKQSLFVLDCNIKAAIPDDLLTVAVSDTSFAAFFPMKGNHWRVVGEIPKELDGKNAITFDDIKKDFARQMQMEITLFDPTWISVYHSHHRCVATFRKGHAFLMGDAAHIHSPIGAQGMNTGFQDAYNLAWKLAFVIKGLAKPALLDTYDTERIAFAKKLVRTTDRVFNLFITPNKALLFFREYIIPRVIKQIIAHKASGQFAFKTVSQIGISYHTSPLSEDASSGSFPKHVPLPGERLPYMQLKQNNKEKNIQEYCDGKHMLLFLFLDTDEVPKNIQTILHAYRFIKYIVFPKTEETKEIYNAFGIERNGYFLIRPDMYIAYRSHGMNTEHFGRYLNKHFLEVKN